MSTESDKDRLDFMLTFGDDVEIRPRGGAAAYPVRGIYDEPGATFNPNQWPGSDYQRQLGAHVTTTSPTFQCRAMDVPGVKKLDQLVDGDTVFNIVDKKPDGAGMITLFLQEQ